MKHYRQWFRKKIKLTANNIVSSWFEGVGAHKAEHERLNRNNSNRSISRELGATVRPPLQNKK